MVNTASVKRGSGRPPVPQCSGLGPLFFSTEPEDVDAAKALCRRCGLRRQCLQDALARGESCGVWGGELLRDGAVLAVTPRRGRPRSVA